MLPAAHRLKGDSNFTRIMKRGRSCYSPEVSIRVVQNGLSISRFAFVTSLKISKKSTVRNLVKRRMREIVRKELLNISKGLDVLISAKPGSEKLSYESLRSSILSTLEKARIYEFSKKNSTKSVA